MTRTSSDDGLDWNKPIGRREIKGVKTVAQARLDRIADPPPTYWRALMKWNCEFRRKPREYPSEDLEQWRRELEAEIKALSLTLEAFPEQGPSTTWEREHERLLRLQGAQGAIRETLAHRARRVPWMTVQEVYACAGSTYPPSPLEFAGWDPFENE